MSRISSTRASRPRRRTGSAPTNSVGTSSRGSSPAHRRRSSARSSSRSPASFSRALLGILSGYMGGTVDMVIQRFVDFMFALPGLLIAIVIVGVVGGGYWMAVLVLSLLNVAGGVRIIRGACAGAASPALRRGGANAGGARASGSCTSTSGATSRRSCSRTRRSTLRSPSSRSRASRTSASARHRACPSGVACSPRTSRSCSRTRRASWPPVLAIVLFATAVTVIGDWIYDRFSFSGRTGR